MWQTYISLSTPFMLATTFRCVPVVTQHLFRSDLWKNIKIHVLKRGWLVIFCSVWLYFFATRLWSVVDLNRYKSETERI